MTGGKVAPSQGFVPRARRLGRCPQHAQRPWDDFDGIGRRLLDHPSGSAHPGFEAQVSEQGHRAPQRQPRVHGVPR